MDDQSFWTTSRLAWFYALLVALVPMLMGYDAGVMSGSIDEIQDDLDLSTTQAVNTLHHILPPPSTSSIHLAPIAFPSYNLICPSSPHPPTSSSSSSVLLISGMARRDHELCRCFRWFNFGLFGRLPWSKGSHCCLSRHLSSR